MRPARIGLFSVLIGLSNWHASRAESYQLTVRVKKTVSTTLEEIYDFRLLIGRIYSASDPGESRALQLVSPQGSSIQGVNSLSLAQDGLTLAELHNSLLGDWKLNETNGSTTNSYLLSLPDLPIDFSAVPVPIVTSPANGAVLGKTFNLIWTNPESDGYRMSEHSNLQRPVFGRDTLHQNGPGNYTASFTDFDQFPIQVDRFNILKASRNLGISLTRLTAGADAVFLNQQLRFDVYSNTISFTIVPEPVSVLLLAIAVLSTTSGRDFVRDRR